MEVWAVTVDLIIIVNSDQLRPAASNSTQLPSFILPTRSLLSLPSLLLPLPLPLLFATLPPPRSFSSSLLDALPITSQNVSIEFSGLHRCPDTTDNSVTFNKPTYKHQESSQCPNKLIFNRICTILYMKIFLYRAFECYTISYSDFNLNCNFYRELSSIVADTAFFQGHLRSPGLNLRS